jgi:hypothetical protein
MQAIADDVGARLRRLQVCKCKRITTAGLLQVTLLCTELVSLSVQDMGLGTSHAYPTISDVLHAAPQLRCIDVTGNKFRAVVDKKFPTLLHNVTELAVTLPANHGVDAFVRFARTLKRLRTLWIRLSKDGNTALVSNLLRMMIPGVSVRCHKKLRLWDREKVCDSYGTDKVVQCASP